MARNGFSTSNYLSGADTRWTDEPITMATWWLSTSNTAAQTEMSLGNNGATGYFRLTLDGTAANDPIGAQKQNDAGTTALGTVNTSFSTSTWYTGAAVFTSDTSRQAFFNATAGTANTTSVTDPTPDFITVGILRRSAVAQPHTGALAESAVWNVALTSEEIAQYSRGVSPMLIRPTALKSYYPCFYSFSTGGESDWCSNGINLTETGTVGNEAHPAKTLAYPVP